MNFHEDVQLDFLLFFVNLQKSGKEVPLGEFDGIDILGNIVEATDLSINSQLYGNLHNMGHNLIAFIHDPDGRHLVRHFKYFISCYC